MLLFVRRIGKTAIGLRSFSQKPFTFYNNGIRSITWKRYYAIVPFNLADIGEGIAEVEILQWFVKPGDKIQQFDKIAEVQSDKAAVEITSRYDGIVKTVHYKIGDTAKVGLPLIDIDTGKDDSATPASPAASTSVEKKTEEVSERTVFSDSNGSVLATPAVRRIAKENKIDLSKVSGTGKDGRVLKEDVQAFIDSASSSSSSEAKVNSVKATPTTTVKVTPTPSLEAKSVPLSLHQKAMVKSMTAALQVPHFGYCEEISMEALYRVRQDIASTTQERNVKVSYMPFFIKAASLALLQFPILNARLDVNANQLHYNASHNIGVAMDTPQGLIVPNIKNVQSLTIMEIAKALNELQKRGAAGKLTPLDLTGGTFTLSNVGTIGGTYTSPVLVVPEVCIGALGQMKIVPRYAENVLDQLDSSSDEDAAILPTPTRIVNVSWSADHRIIDGATMARFSTLWKHYLERPSLMLLDL